MTFPCAENVGGHRVFDYEIRAEAEGAEAVARRIMAPGFAFPEKYANLPGTCLFSPSELPADRTIRFTVTPRDCFGGKGRPLAVAFSLAMPSLSDAPVFAAPITSHAVLQRDCALPVWGTAQPGSTVTVTLDDQRLSATADRESGETVSVAVPEGFAPVKVRFAWDDYPVCNLVNGEGLPCGPFELAIH